MTVLREIREVETNKLEITLPDEFKKKKLEIIIFPIEETKKKLAPRKKLNLTTYKCYGKKRDFTRKDAYNDRI
jgi:hypothetical protein